MSEHQENQSEKPKFPTLQFADFLENSPPYHPGEKGSELFFDKSYATRCRFLAELHRFANPKSILDLLRKSKELVTIRH